jgi:hypothetical protein
MLLDKIPGIAEVLLSSAPFAESAARVGHGRGRKGKQAQDLRVKGRLLEHDVGKLGEVTGLSWVASELLLDFVQDQESQMAAPEPAPCSSDPADALLPRKLKQVTKVTLGLAMSSLQENNLGPQRRRRDSHVCGDSDLPPKRLELAPTVRAKAQQVLKSDLSKAPGWQLAPVDSKQ